MARFVALLRGINVSGHRQIAMADLQRSLQAAGLRDVRTYLQSGNAVFEADEDDPEVVAAAIHTRIAADFGHQVEVLVLPCATVARVASSNPFASSPDADERWLHATFLLRPASEAAFAELQLPAGQGELAVLADGVVFLHLPNGYGRTKLNNAYFERALGTPATTRNWRTVMALAVLCAGDGEGQAAVRGAAASPPAADAPSPKAAARREPGSPA
jgi:uncharacterized protein (DUF1697 family)